MGISPEATAPLEGQPLPPSREVFLYFLLLGFVNVGGPVAQIMIFQVGF